MMSLMSLMLVLTSPTIAWVASTSRCSAGPSPPTACDVSSSSQAILSFGSTARPLLAASSAGPISAGHRALGDGLSRREVLVRRYAVRHQVEVLLADRRHRVHVGRRVGRDLVAVVDAHRPARPARWARRR